VKLITLAAEVPDSVKLVCAHGWFRAGTGCVKDADPLIAPPPRSGAPETVNDWLCACGPVLPKTSVADAVHV
jgi:hypothetical protein